MINICLSIWLIIACCWSVYKSILITQDGAICQYFKIIGILENNFFSVLEMIMFKNFTFVQLERYLLGSVLMAKACNKVITVHNNFYQQ